MPMLRSEFCSSNTDVTQKDAYTFLDIKAGNPYGIRPWIYNSSDAIILGKERAEGNALDERTEYGEDNK
jgi:hypothetical protein